MKFASLNNKKFCISVILVLSLIFLSGAEKAFSYSVRLSGCNGRKIQLERPPERVVSLVPGITEILFELGAGDRVKGLTYHDTLPPEAALKPVVGGFFSPSPEKVLDLAPSLVFASSLQKNTIKELTENSVDVVCLETGTLEDSFKNIQILGKIFNKEKEALKLEKKIKNELSHIEKKLNKIPDLKKKRVMRLMGRAIVMTPGDDSFQNQIIEAAGGIPPKLGKNGPIVRMSLEEWKKFNPEFLYGCGGDREIWKMLKTKPGWKDVDAVKNNNIYWFPCELTCRAAAHTGYFASWLSGEIYKEAFSKEKNQVIPNGVTESKTLNLDLDYIKTAGIVTSFINDFKHKTLLITFKKPLEIVSTVEGYREGVKSVGNHGIPPCCWGLGHLVGFDEGRRRTFKGLGISEKDTALLETGANMDNLALVEKSFKEQRVYALVTAGVESNAVRMGKDTGAYYEPGTINIILLTNAKLSKRAMTRAVISATETKTAALQDLDIRSSQNSAFQATGTGTDNIIVVGGDGPLMQLTGGHIKMGELIAKAVYDAVTEAVFRQNGLTPKRNIFKRLKERNISVYGLVANNNCECGLSSTEAGKELEFLLMNPVYAGFVAQALAISDDYEKGLISNLDGLSKGALSVSSEIAGKPVKKLNDLIKNPNMPQALEIALEALLNGISFRNRP